MGRTSHCALLNIHRFRFDKDPNIRMNAAKALGEIKNPKAVEPLIVALKDENPGVREEAAKALVQIGVPAVNVLIDALKDGDADVRERATWALGAIKDSIAVKPLIALLKDKNPRVQEQAVKALIEIGKPAINLNLCSGG